MSIDLFHPLVSNWFEKRFATASPPQLQGWPAIADGQNTLILAPTGSGKTLAAFLWCIDELLRLGMDRDAKEFERNLHGIHTLYISPLKALNNDIHRNLKEPLAGIHAEAEAAGTPAPLVRVQVRTGDTPASERAAMLRKPPHILITTPESLFLLLTSVKGRELFRNLRYVIIDEIHNISANKRGVHLSLSLERLEVLCHKSPVRIGLSATQKPLERIAAFLAGQTRADDGNWHPRPVTIVDCGQRKDLDVRVIAPVADYSELPEASVWPAVYQKLYELIRSHRTTLIFANMRAQTEKIARQLNEMHSRQVNTPDAIIALAHHGSLSKETRFDIENRLKSGDIPAVVATASLELGIDIGSIDLVVQLEAPRSVASALQRVGRSGHLLSATSKGRIIPLYSADLDDCVATTLAMHAGEIEETRIPENCLDVLAQQIVAEVAMQPQDRQQLYLRLRGSYCYRLLPEDVFNQVVEMLSGSYAQRDLKALAPRLTWDRVNDQLIARHGSRMLAVMNMGTIPDRAYYGVYLQDSKTRLGEVEEEFVFESRVGDHFFLGNNEWRILAIDRNQITVAPIEAQKPRAPFWKGESLFRDLGTSQHIGRFRRGFLEQGTAWPADMDKKMAEEAIWQNLRHYLSRQHAHCDGLATDRQFVVETFTDSGGQPYLVMHAPLGARITGLWAIGLASVLQQHGIEVQYAFDDDCVVLRLPESCEWPEFDALFALSVEVFEGFLRNALISTPLFSVRFRHNAARALLLPRSRPHKRIPLWLQRLRAADLLQSVRDSGDFPILLETYRDCLQDLFDWPGLRQVLQQINDKEISLHTCRTPSPSPMAAGVLFRFVSNNMYEYDRSRLPGQAASVSSELLAEILSRETIPAIVTAEMVAEAEARWQHTDPAFRARDAEDLYALLQKLGPLHDAELNVRCQKNPQAWLQSLADAGRIVYDESGQAWRVVGGDFVDAGTTPEQHLEEKVLRFLRPRGPQTLRQIAEALDTTPESIQTVLDRAVAAAQVVHGKLIVDWTGEQYCDRDHFAELYRRAVVLRRGSEGPFSLENLQQFLLSWNGISAPFRNQNDVIEHYMGYPFTPRFFEAELLIGRMSLQDDSVDVSFFAESVRHGEIVVYGWRSEEKIRLRVGFFKRGNGHLLFTAASLAARAEELQDSERLVWQFLREQGASYMDEIEQGCQLTRAQTVVALRGLAAATLVSCDEYRTFLETLFSLDGQVSFPEMETLSHAVTPSWPRTHPPRVSRDAVRKKMQTRIQQQRGRWFLLASYSAMGKEISSVSQAEAQARLLLLRYGILVKEWYRRESGLLPWPRLFQVLKRMEWQGEIRRGYFIQGLSGIQFALPEALERLKAIVSAPEPGGTVHLISMADPAFPLSPDLVPAADGTSALPPRLPGNYLAFNGKGQVIAILENYGVNIRTTHACADADIDALAAALKHLLALPVSLRPRRFLAIERIDDGAAAASPRASAFLDQGYHHDGKCLVLWPSDL